MPTTMTTSDQHQQLAAEVDGVLAELRVRLLSDARSQFNGGHMQGGIRQTWRYYVTRLVMLRSRLGIDLPAPSPLNGPPHRSH